MMGAVLARQMGLPIERLVIATNAERRSAALPHDGRL